MRGILCKTQSLWRPLAGSFSAGNAVFPGKCRAGGMLTSGAEIRKIEYMRRCLQLFWSCCLASSLLHADGQPFDLSGPKVDVHVKRGDVTLPISEVPNLMPGDRLWVHPDLPESQAAHFVLVVAFLRGSTNPPPPEWFTRVETWTREARDEGVFVTVPPEAQQALLFLAPETTPAVPPTKGSAAQGEQTQTPAPKSN